MDPILILLFLALALGIGLLAAAVRGESGRWWALAAAVVALVVASLFAGHSWTGIVLLNGAELLAVALVASQGATAAAGAARTYLLAVVPAIVATMAAFALAGLDLQAPAAPLDKVVVCLLVIGFALKLGLVPVYFWLPAVAAASSAMTMAVIVSIVDIAAFAELYNLRLVASWIFTGYAPVWGTLAVLSLLGGALLALAQNRLRVMLAFSSIEDLGYLLLGLVAGGTAGASGAWLGALSHALCKAVLFGAVGLAESRIGQPVTLETRGLASRVPVAGAAFLIGALAFVGVPPALGFAGHWRLYLAGAELGGPGLLGVMFAASALSLLCYARAIHRTWLGAVNVTSTPAPATGTANAALVVLAVAIVVFGLHPALLLATPETPASAIALIGEILP